MSPGGRADFMVNCSEVGLYEIISTNDNTQDPEMLSRFTERVHPGKVLFRLEVNDDSDDGPIKLPLESDIPNKTKGSYIQDLSTLNDNSPGFETECPCNYNNASDNKCEIEFKFKGGSTINGKQFNITTPDYPHTADALILIQYNKSYEFVINNNGNDFNVTHAYHQHINPFQVQTHIGKNG
eukprot:CAMPEP_0201563638 /NCGR_PEP_ID=MMETSP0190_2-20130828/770_1 /ASSEMBLY_ACC=CAM_ASM_000263 /TAXON_ID=37353 /ORGANISM="Rosalina sp." /LENGTH=181 /DNA_ID=CAMNT_0047978673 /DNA_START=167 /DNA_END=709 /DNA_ORIENTATION=-